MFKLKKIIAGMFMVSCFLPQVTLASGAEKDHKIYMNISKTGLNKISNPPHKITDVIGDRSTFKIQSEKDGEYIYLMPMGRVGENFEITIKNNLGKLQEFVFKIEDIKSQTITVDDKKIQIGDSSISKEEISNILHAIKTEQVGKFFVEKINKPVIGVESPKITAIESYKWEGIKAVKFEVWNTGVDRRIVEDKISVEEVFYPKKWKNLLIYWSSAEYLDPEEYATVIAIFRDTQEIR